MNERCLNLDQSIDWIKSGKILAHPTESIWGLGCDANNEEAVNQIFKLKKRNKDKNFILLAPSFEVASIYLKDVSKKDLKYINKFWPGPYTFLFQFNEKLPYHLKNNTGKIAIRVSNHLPLKSILKTINILFVSTSANLSGESVFNCPKELIKCFDSDILAYYDAPLGTNKKPSKIIDLETRKVIRD